jgi:hypothetical protein
LYLGCTVPCPDRSPVGQNSSKNDDRTENAECYFSHIHSRDNYSRQTPPKMNSCHDIIAYSIDKHAENNTKKGI